MIQTFNYFSYFSSLDKGTSSWLASGEKEEIFVHQEHLEGAGSSIFCDLRIHMIDYESLGDFIREIAEVNREDHQ